MIAAACLDTGLPPAAFLDERFGGILLSMWSEQQKKQQEQSLLDRARARWGH